MRPFSVEVEADVDFCVTEASCFSFSNDSLAAGPGTVSCSTISSGSVLVTCPSSTGDEGADCESIFFAKIVRRSEYPRFRERERPALSGLCGDVGESAERGEREERVARLASGEVGDKRLWGFARLVFIESPLDDGRRSH